jgi:hypothetical protein
MTIERLHSSYILRLTQRLSHLTYELLDVRTGQTYRFESVKELSGFLEAALKNAAPEPVVKGNGR